MPGGRPTKYNKRLADKICNALADGKSLRKICNPKDMPNRGTVYRWLGENEKFNNQYARAKREMAEDMAEEILEIADDTSMDMGFKKSEDKDGKGATPFVDKENIQRSRVRIDTRKWLMSKLIPKKYGDKQEIEHSGELKIGFAETLKQKWDERKRG